ncbi:TPA: glycosyltransferase [Raoultella ornithinolytica]|uniref:glycosyltransferase family 2 protein n=1 Tax=Raoultella ornithinolytica TaxID=54291 RepID=UPI0015DC5743|nr:glycosyltransferase [Raoultella ornithinolytica]QLK20765.1 glycosyltransferase [Raoultella ornithinolytica]WKL85372.1 glycosyltransferase [Raoultella ornithinolytica]HAT2374447.1 glycosyltransferase family 2 protein [Raoultella ornithinolytica]HAU5002259.1 glycosyltransferase family 2 protein [Raoultella ornithinolytica]HCD1179779.1 glycosyltransferase family 2 protein [Raoultella ornithinolytica]
MKYILAIPTYNGGEKWKEVATAIRLNSREEVIVKVIDSGSTDDTVAIALENGFDVVKINKSDFNHGGTRNLAFENIAETDIVIFLTQDAIPCAGFIDEILLCFDDPSVACAYGRQLPHREADAIAIHARNFNYAKDSYKYTLSDIEKKGIKTVFMSNSFSAYKVNIFTRLDGFPSHTILCEDMFYAAKAIKSGYSICYMADAKVYHSHNYTAVDEFKRYFDIGVFHEKEPWIRELTGGLGGEGKKFVISEMKYLYRNKPGLIIKALLSTAMKFLGLKMGGHYSLFPVALVKKMSMHKGYWK